LSLNNIIRKNLYLMEELATMPFSITQELWSSSADGDDDNTTLGSTINRSLNIMQSLVSTPFEIALDFFEPDQKQKQNATGGTDQSEQNMATSSQYSAAQNQQHHFPPNAEH